jgi:hypothetical protein
LMIRLQAFIKDISGGWPVRDQGMDSRENWVQGGDAQMRWGRGPVQLQSCMSATMSGLKSGLMSVVTTSQARFFIAADAPPSPEQRSSINIFVLGKKDQGVSPGLLRLAGSRRETGTGCRGGEANRAGPGRGGWVRPAERQPGKRRCRREMRARRACGWARASGATSWRACA